MSTVSTQAHFLKNKHAVIFGAGGAVGTAVAKELAAHGATVFLSGRAKNDVEQVVADITKDGAVAYAARRFLGSPTHGHKSDPGRLEPRPVFLMTGCQIFGISIHNVRRID